MSRTFFATCALGLEQVVADDLATLGAESIRPQRGRVAFRGELPIGYAACMWVRAASRVQEQLFRDRPAGSRQQLYDAVARFDWSGIINPGLTLAISAAVRESRATDSRFAALVVKDAIVDQVREQHGTRPNVDADDPDVPLRVVIRQDRATVLRDLSGDSLHRRGWRPIQVKSPLNEALAAGLLQLAGWKGERALMDPMCGSGTFLIEAAHMAQDRAPGLRREFAFQRWPDLEGRAWKRIVEDAEQRYEAGKDRELSIAGADHHAGALSIAAKSISLAEVEDVVKLRKQALATHRPRTAPQLVVSNPPWGLRMDQQLEETWTDLGRFLKTHCAGATAYLLSGDAELTRPLRLKAAQRHPVRIATVDARWIRYELRGADGA